LTSLARKPFPLALAHLKPLNQFELRGSHGVEERDAPT
jgi:hypothetical protein